MHTEFGNNSTYIQCNDGSMNIIHKDLNDIIENGDDLNSNSTRLLNSVYLKDPYKN